KMHKLLQKSPVHIWQSRINLEDEAASFNTKARQKLQKIIDRARDKAGDDDNFPEVEKDSHRIVDKDCTMFHLDGKVGKKLRLDPERLFEDYRKVITPDRQRLLSRYRIRDTVFKAVGIGSVGTFCCIALFETRDDERLFLQIKEARESVLERF